MSQISKAILRTIAYADIFDYPLRQSEIWRFLISKIQIPKSKFQKNLDLLSLQVANQNDVYFLKGREKIVALRQKREEWSRPKMTIARRVAGRLKLIPTVKMVAVTGALAMNNADRNDDIDLLIVTGRNRLWLTRLLTIFLVELVAKRRRPNDKVVANKICLNMFLDEDCLAVPQNEQDLFSAHEVCQLRLLWDKNNCYQKFIKANLWSQKFLANWKP
ncbi:hypothetical protein COT65_02390 [Candidatus Shapirobacteria bacterium CG09_land_8_20_14_0_10_47_13]|uniref:Polymerase nucleotidyl transferase domain-containing protein n=1 Tax=Candidatus Shapirobacteria bacterium CG09_land_8_20_14_0_10_47_13 TaxID=1974481 RepID=A0A2H0WMA6_9BACT|nr:MAG: hypothetical protein COT65_02390 [Candidatus Shapirobacteria bacterium CG09_land_8_20_14_0_10_47_13]